MPLWYAITIGVVMLFALSFVCSLAYHMFAYYLCPRCGIFHKKAIFCDDSYSDDFAWKEPCECEMERKRKR